MNTHCDDTTQHAPHAHAELEWCDGAPEATDPTPGEVGLTRGERTAARDAEVEVWRKTAERKAAQAHIAEAREAELRATVERVRETERRAAWDWFLESLEAHMLKGQPVWDEAVAHRRELLSRAALTTPPTTEAGE